ncbi:MAG: efflux RND transporter periplasmic adaptor subunit [Patescibacteria group bacterium]
MIKKISEHVLKRKGVYSLVAIVLATGGYFGAQTLKDDTAETKYVLAAAEKGTLISSVSGTGQISASNQVDIKPKTSGEVISVSIKKGQEVKSGEIIVKLNAQDAYRDIRDAQDSLESAELSLERLKEPESDYSILQAENALASAKNNLEKLKLSQEAEYKKAEEEKADAEKNIDEGYEDALDIISDVFLDLPNVIAGLNAALYGYEISDHQATVGGRQDNTSALFSTTNVDARDSLWVFKNKAESNYKKAREKYEESYEIYKNIDQDSEREAIEELFRKTLDTTKAVAEAIKSEISYLASWVDFRTEMKWEIFPEVESYQKNISGYLSQTNGNTSSLTSIQRTIDNNFEAVEDAIREIEEMGKTNPLDIAAAEATIKEREASLKNLKTGPDALDLRSAELSVRQRREALAEARAQLADYVVKAPFSGVVAEVNVEIGDSVSSGTAIATLITKQRIAEISLNEVDAAKVKIGQKVTLTFDAVSDLTLTGEVAEMDALGTVTQGVVSYNIKIIFDTQDERVKPGMSVSASIVTDLRQDAILVPNAAVKSSGGISYVEMPDEIIVDEIYSSVGGIILKNSPRRQVVEVGLANDAYTEIISGLSAGDQIILRTVTSSTSSTSSGSSGTQIKTGGSTFLDMGGGAPAMGGR